MEPSATPRPQRRTEFLRSLFGPHFRSGGVRGSIGPNYALTNMYIHACMHACMHTYMYAEKSGRTMTDMEH